MTKHIFTFIESFVNQPTTMKITILILALVAMAYAAQKTDNIEERVENRLEQLQQELKITKEMMMEMDESEVAVQAVNKAQTNLAKAQIVFVRIRSRSRGGWQKR